ncbi:MAG: adenylate/guanylate cyclase domain-containing protein, partial [Cyanothece sp. SIO1E1]|nr:adenylate/guanylate cyclase domain-containing protein [Cyanothece sp. SIO1E1]
MEIGVPSSAIRGHRTLAAIVVTDGVGFSAMMSRDEERTLSVIHRDLQLMRELSQQFEGQVLKSTGDGLLMYFMSAVQAVNCAVEIQKALAAANTDIAPDEVLQHRIGIHLGDVFFSETDVMGNGCVNQGPVSIDRNQEVKIWAVIIGAARYS